MKTNRATLQITALLSATMLLGGSAFGQPANAPRVNPANGMPEAPGLQPGAVDPATGMPASEPGHLSTTDPVQASYQADQAVKQLISDHRYEEALKRCLTFHEQYRIMGSLVPLLPDWIELGRRYPDAKDALIKIRNQDVHEFAAGRGYMELFSEVTSINNALQQEGATYELFNSFRDKDPELARQCYFFVESLLVARGDYQWLYDHMGEVETKLDSSHHFMTMQLEQAKRMAAMTQANRERIAEMNRAHGWTNAPAIALPDTSAMMRRSAENGFVSQSCRLIEILVGVGRTAEAEKVRDQALAILDDDRLKSAVADAMAKIKK